MHRRPTVGGQIASRYDGPVACAVFVNDARCELRRRRAGLTAVGGGSDERELAPLRRALRGSAAARDRVDVHLVARAFPDVSVAGGAAATAAAAAAALTAAAAALMTAANGSNCIRSTDCATSRPTWRARASCFTRTSTLFLRYIFIVFCGVCVCVCCLLYTSPSPRD